MPSCIRSTIFGKYVGVRLVSALKRWKWLLIIDWLYSGKLPPALTPNLFLKWLVLQAQDRMASLRNTYFKKFQKELQLPQTMRLFFQATSLSVVVPLQICLPGAQLWRCSSGTHLDKLNFLTFVGGGQAQTHSLLPQKLPQRYVVVTILKNWSISFT